MALLCEAGGVEEDENGYVALSQRSAPRPDDRVRITQGAMADRVGIFDAPSDRHRAFLLLDRQIQVNMPANALESAG